MEVMELNEQLMELEMEKEEEGLKRLEEEMKALLSSLYEQIRPIVDQFQNDHTGVDKLLQVKEYYYQKKYLQRILDKIVHLRNIASP